MYVAQPIEWTERGVIMLDQRRYFFSCHSERSSPASSFAPHSGAPDCAVEESWLNQRLDENRWKQGTP
jgi:hypothetical protein